jgi:cytochrome c oxidase assembly protein subunit 15
MADRSTQVFGSPWPYRLAVVTTLCTLVLIFVGGVVTNTGSGLAVPDWPTTFGYNMFTYPPSMMVGGILYEHSHRLIGSLVGMLTVAFVVTLWRTDSRPWVRWLGVVALLAVITQGVLGGLRVVLLQHGLAIVHGCFAHAFLALIVGLCVCTSRWWHVAADTTRVTEATRLRTVAWVTLAVVYAQIIFGALLTHTGTRLGLHLALAGAVVLCSTLLTVWILSGHPERLELRRPALVLIALVVMQLSLGLGAYFYRFTSMNQTISPTVGLGFLTIHRLNGACVLAATAALTVILSRLAGLAQQPRAATMRGQMPVRREGEVLA